MSGGRGFELIISPIKLLRGDFFLLVRGRWVRSGGGMFGILGLFVTVVGLVAPIPVVPLAKYPIEMVPGI